MNIFIGPLLLIVLVSIEFLVIKYVLKEEIPWEEVTMNLNSGHILMWVFRGGELFAYYYIYTYHSFNFFSQWETYMIVIFAFFSWDFCFFLIGFFVNNSEKLLSSLKKYANKILMIGIVFGVFSIIPQLWFTKTDLSYYTYIKSLAIILSCTAIYFLTIGIWGYFSKLEIKDNKILRYLTDSSYWVYLSNMPLVAMFHILFIPLQIPIYVKFIFSFIGALTLSFLTYEFLVRYTFIGGILNKRRFRNRK